MFQEQPFPPLEQHTRPFLNTAEAAFYLNRSPQTLRLWACKGGVITPIRIKGRLAWKINDIKQLLGMENK